MAARISKSPQRRRSPPPVDHARFAPRKKPQQERARRSVAYIKQSALRLARERGVVGFSTDDVAARAGVNVASIYQYFPNREAILFSIYQDAANHLLESMKALNAEIFDLPILDAARRAMDRLLGLYEERQFELLHLTAGVPDLERAVRPVSFENLNAGTMHGFLLHRLPPSHEQDVGRMSFFILNIGLGCIRDYLLNRPAGLSREQFLDDLSWIIAGYVEHRCGKSQWSSSKKARSFRPANA